MKNSKRNKITLETWDKLADVYNEMVKPLKIYNEAYDKFLEKLPNSDSKVLDLGCGPGMTTKYLKEKNDQLEIEGTDVSPQMIKLAKKNNPEVKFKVMDCRDLDLVQKKYDGIICGFCIPYLSKMETEKLMRDVQSLLCPDGIFYISFIENDYSKSAYQIGSTGDKAYVYYYKREYLKLNLEKIGLKITDEIEVNYPKKNEIQKHIILMSRKK